MTIEHVGTNVEQTQYATSVPDGIVEISETERGLLPNTRYVIRVRAFNNLGVSSDWSEAIEFGTASDDTVPSTPGNLVLSTVDGHLTILWDEVTTNEDGTPITDLAFYEILLQDNIEYSGELLPPFRYTSIANSYTFLYSANKAIHDALDPPQAPSEDWTVIVRAVDFSGNASGDATNDLTLSFGGSSVDFPVNFTSTDYDGTSVGDHDATDGIKLEENGEAEFKDLRVNGTLWANGRNIGKPPIFHGSRRTTDSVRTVADDDVNTVPVVVRFSNPIDVYTTSWNTTDIVTYDSPWVNINVDGWYRITITHRWDENTTGSRQSMITLNASYPSGSGGFLIPMGAHHGSFPALSQNFNMFTDQVILPLTSANTILPRVYQNSGGPLDLVSFELTIELISY